MNKRQAKRQARLLAARILEREVTHGRLILSIAEAESLSDRDAKRLHDAYFEIVDKLYDTRIATPE